MESNNYQKQRIQRINEKQKKGKNLLKKTNNAISHALPRHSANNRRFFQNFDQHSFFVFSFNFGVLLIVTIYIQTKKVRL